MTLEDGLGFGPKGPLTGGSRAKSGALQCSKLATTRWRLPTFGDSLLATPTYMAVRP